VASLADQYPGDTFKSLLRVDNNTSGITGTAQQIYDGEGTGSILYLGSSSAEMFGNFTVGANGTGYDVKFFGDTVDKYMLWDQSADKLIVQGELEVNSIQLGGDLNVEGDATFSGDSVYLKDASYDSGTPVKALSLNTSDGAIKVAGVEMKVTGVLKLKTLTQVDQEALTPAIGDIVMRTDGMTLNTEPYLYSD
tara:strand:+ start:320 stop:901 length:582 start_codon:yes stop_codon:yes gene_type:complete